MNPLIKKELRQLLPNFGVACALLLVAFLLPFNVSGDWKNVFLVIVQFLNVAVVLQMAVNTFGAEVSLGTFSAMLALPVARLRIWRLKTRLLAGSLFVLGCLWWLAFAAKRLSSGLPFSSDDYYSLAITISFGLAIYSGGLWTVLQLRQVSTAFWFTLVMPGGVAALVSFGCVLCGNKSDALFVGLLTVGLILYSLAGFLYARRLFMQAQDVAILEGIWLGNIGLKAAWLPGWRSLVGQKTSVTERRDRHPVLTLCRKELALHESAFITAALLFGLHLGALAVRYFYKSRLSITLDLFLSAFWIFWLMLPLVVGCVAVAEERKLGTLEGLLILPVKRRTQFIIKLATVLVLSLFFGLLVPLLLQGGILPELHLTICKMQAAGALHLDTTSAGWHFLQGFDAALPFLTMAVAVMLIGLISFYISTFAYNLLQAVGPATAGILMAILFGVVICLLPTLPWLNLQTHFWSGSLPFFTIFPLVLLTVVMLASRNFTQLRPGAKLMWQNLGVLFVAVVGSGVLTTAIYHRCWEYLTVQTPTHGAARLTVAGKPALSDVGNVKSLLLPDGRVAVTGWGTDQRLVSPVDVLLANLTVTSTPPVFLSGSNWSKVECLMGDFVGIKADGTLWVSDQSWQGTNSGSEHPMVQMGTDTNWLGLAVNRPSSVFLVKQDHTLWRWGTNFNGSKKPWPGIKNYPLQRMGMESNWVQVARFGLSWQACFYRDDGSCWSLGDWSARQQRTMEIAPGFVIHEVSGVGAENFRSKVAIFSRSAFLAGIAGDGTFRIYAKADESPHARNHNGNYLWIPMDIPLGTDTNWVAAAGGWQKIVTLKNDGTLWVWDFSPRTFEWWQADSAQALARLQQVVPTRLDRHSDWVAVSGISEDVTSLAADGTLWYWPQGLTAGYYFSSQGVFAPLLDISRRPRLLGNMFADGQ